MTWNAREFSVAEAARVASIHRAHLDVIISRNKHLDVLFSAKRKGRRWFSPQDIAVLRLAFELERAGRNWLTAIAHAFEHLATPPPPDALLVVPVLSVACTSGRVLTGLAVPLVPSESTAVFPIGAIVADIVAKCDDIYKGAA